MPNTESQKLQNRFSNRYKQNLKARKYFTLKHQKQKISNRENRTSKWRKKEYLMPKREPQFPKTYSQKLKNAENIQIPGTNIRIRSIIVEIMLHVCSTVICQSKEKLYLVLKNPTLSLKLFLWSPQGVTAVRKGDDKRRGYSRTAEFSHEVYTSNRASIHPFRECYARTRFSSPPACFTKASDTTVRLHFAHWTRVLYVCVLLIRR